MRSRTPALRWVLATLLTACTACTGGSAPTESGTTAVPDRSGDIVLASGRDVTGKGGIRQQLIDTWNARQGRLHTGRHARLVELPGSADQQRSQLLGALQSDSAQYDVINLDVTWVPEFADVGLIRPLPGMVDADVIPSVAGTARWNGKVYAAPFNSDVGLLYYRSDYLKRAGVQNTDLSKGLDWSKLKELIGTLDETRGKDRPKGYEKGWTAQFGAYEGRTVNGVEALASAQDAVNLTDGDGRYTASVQDLENGLAELRDRTQGPYLLKDALHSDEGESLTDFADGRTAFLRHWPYAYRTLHQSLRSTQLGVAPLPGKAVLGGQNLALTRSSGQEAGARDLIKFLTGVESERCLLDAGFAATRKSAYQNNDVICRSERPSAAASATASPSSSGESTDRMPRDDHGRPRYARDVLLPALTEAVSRPRTPLYGAFTQTFTTELGKLFTDDPPSDSELAKDLNESLRRVLPGG
ncbi:extracellular solute-binding protein [Streptomyces sp. NPDC005548]|uniref:extracellular solute-binding protein n=1 Tax=Streptomyces sp. NPDC005548 TaxID=3364724 RepID=UPI0036BB4DC3